MSLDNGSSLAIIRNEMGIKTQYIKLFTVTTKDRDFSRQLTNTLHYEKEYIAKSNLGA